MKEQLVVLIEKKLNQQKEKLKDEFQESNDKVGVRYCVVDDLLPNELATRINQDFPNLEQMRLMESFREKKYTTKNFEKLNPMMADITFAIQDPRIIAIVEYITGIKNQIPDPSLYAGGLSAMTKGHFLGPHIDNSHEASRRYYRTLNLLYYATPDWRIENGGNLELWDEKVRKNVTIVSKFNRMAIMETTPTAWHSVSEVTVDTVRSCVSNYYFSEQSPTNKKYFNVTSFSARPEQPIRRIVSRIDNNLRQLLRAVKPGGLGKQDVYIGPKK
ncbi:MAG: hypothetical protein RL748_2987 [Pseudomonadota bacterium]|jgi:Rps23 Pro-64 3,4-dihydroxylase Tpa1-like proline 4-hydroxylase